RQWSKLSPSTTPLARYGQVMVYDESIRQIVLTNGNTAYQGHQDDTWLYDTAANTWTEVFTTGTSGRLKWPGMVYDSSNERCILFGGQVEDDPVDRTMIFNSETDTWVSANPASAPESRINPGMAFDVSGQVVVLFGGMNHDYDQLGDTWCYSYVDNVWTDMSTEPTSTGTSTNTSPADSELPLTWIVIPAVIVVVVLILYLVRRRI
ncbi:MAG: hypothetical protein P1Q69_05660, partial [Candidatus Thorarchaeota archaeon]|nr:hypothetical protein [Candidatus Thorarchaeota archaeon]